MPPRLLCYTATMVTQELLQEHLGRRPFAPFRVMLTNGENIDITRTAQAVAMKRRLVVGTTDDRLRWLWLEQIDRVDLQLPNQA